MQARGIDAWRNEHSPIVVFPRPSADLIGRWSLAPHGEIAHIVCLSHVTEELLEHFIDHYCEDRASQDS